MSKITKTSSIIIQERVIDNVNVHFRFLNDWVATGGKGDCIHTKNEDNSQGFHY